MKVLTTCKELGDRGERAAADYLSRHGFRIVAKNFSSRMGEIDLIASRPGELHFIEVKTRSSSSFFNPEEAVDYRKQMKLKRTAQIFLSRCEKQFAEHDIYMGIISVVMASNTSVKINHLIDAFQ
ncbi:MAG: YraN family protein [Candidatus Omnitrophica bacterium]|nr:YraN family protein [Candidatus Omnitrophota bacterium]